MPDQEGEIILHGNYAQLTEQLFLTKSIQQMIKWYSSDGDPSIISKSGGVKRNDKVSLMFYFLEEKAKSTSDVFVDKRRPLSGTISMRLMELESPTRKNEIAYTKEQFVTLGEKVKAQLATPPIIWYKGKKLYSYSDWQRGLQFQLLARDEVSARTVINACLDVRGYSFNEECFNLVENKAEAQRYPDTSDSITLLGQKTYFKKERPVVPVVFQWAKLYFPTIDESFLLYSRRNSYKQKPIVAT